MEGTVTRRAGLEDKKYAYQRHTSSRKNARDALPQRFSPNFMHKNQSSPHRRMEYIATFHMFSETSPVILQDTAPLRNLLFEREQWPTRYKLLWWPQTSCAIGVFARPWATKLDFERGAHRGLLSFPKWCKELKFVSVPQIRTDNVIGGLHLSCAPRNHGASRLGYKRMDTRRPTPFKVFH